MKLNNKEKNLLAVLMLAILFYFTLLRIDSVMAAAGAFINLLQPFIIGGAIAFVINVPMAKIEKLPEKLGLKKVKRVLAFVVTVLAATAVVSGFLLVVVPQLVQTVITLAEHLQLLFARVPGMIEGMGSELGFVKEYIYSLEINWRDTGRQIVSRLQDFALSLINSGSGIVKGIVSGFATALLSVIFSVYLIFGKEKNTAAVKRLCKTVLGEKASKHIFHVAEVSYRSFANFLSGQCLEAVILGSMFVVAMTVFRLPYAMLIGLIIAVTALVPVFGAFIGCGIGVVLIAIESPARAVWFVLLFLVLQQIEGNIIYPRVVGNKVGLPSILVFVSVILGNSIMGVAGMLIFIPAVSIIYTLVKEYVEAKESQGAEKE